MFTVPEPMMGMEPPTPLTKSFLEDLVNDEKMERSWHMWEVHPVSKIHSEDLVAGTVEDNIQSQDFGVVCPAVWPCVS